MGHVGESGVLWQCGSYGTPVPVHMFSVLFISLDMKNVVRISLILDNNISTPFTVLSHQWLSFCVFAAKTDL